MVRTTTTATTSLSVVMALAVFAFGCGESEQSRISADLFTWDSATEDFIEGLPEIDGAEEVRVRVAEPTSGNVISQVTASIDDAGVRIPELEGSSGLRLEFAVRDDSETLATGATPTFGVREGHNQAFRTMVTEIGTFAPVGSLVRGSSTGNESYITSTYDDRELDVSWYGRAGHTAKPTDSGELLVVAGGQVSNMPVPAEVPSITQTFTDIQIFDPATGYFTELAGDEAAREAGVVGQDRLEEGRAFHAVTPLGDDRFLVTGGFGSGGAPVGTVELIDLDADPGERVQTLEGADQLAQARGMHTATFRESDETVVVAGGLGNSADDVVGTIEVIDPDPADPAIESGIQMESPRVGHGAVLLEDDATVWFIGGRQGSDGSDILSSTEQFGETGETETGPSLNQARYEASVIHLGDQGNDLVAIFGGLSAGGARSSYELGNPLLQDTVDTSGDWEIGEARGGADVYHLPDTDDVVLVGGYDRDREPTGSAERFSFDAGAVASDDMHYGRGAPATGYLTNGRILVTGGEDIVDHVARHDAEYFNPDLATD